MPKLFHNMLKKTVQPTFLYDVILKTDTDEEISPDSIISVKIPTYELTKNTFVQGSLPRYFLTFAPDQALELTMTVVENMGYYADGGLTRQDSIRNFIHKQLEKVINPNGYHYSPSNYINTKLPIIVNIKDYDNTTLSRISFRNWSYVGGQQTQDFGYGSEEVLTYDLTFTFERYEVEFLDKKIRR